MLEFVNLTLTNILLVEIQLKRAITLFLDDEDYVSALTLAGAAEEISGKLISKAGGRHALDEIIDASIQMERIVSEVSSERKEVIALANYFRDRLKHCKDDEPFNFSANYYAADLIMRAINNYSQLTSTETPEMRRFREAVKGWF